MNNTFIYVLIDPNTNYIRYIGKSNKGKPAWNTGLTKNTDSRVISTHYSDERRIRLSETMKLWHHNRKLLEGDNANN